MAKFLSLEGAQYLVTKLKTIFPELDANAKIPATYLPAYVDDVIEGANLAAFPASGEAGKIYVALDTNKTYRWSGSAYVVISETLALGTTSTTAYRGDYGNTAYAHSQSAHAPSNAQKNSDITKAEIEAKLTGTIATHTHNYEAIEGLVGEIEAVKQAAKDDLAKKLTIPSATATFYVDSANGNDDNDGSSTGTAKKTIDAVLSAIQGTYYKKYSISINLAAGSYTLTGSLIGFAHYIDRISITGVSAATTTLSCDAYNALIQCTLTNLTLTATSFIDVRYIDVFTLRNVKLLKYMSVLDTNVYTSSGYTTEIGGNSFFRMGSGATLTWASELIATTTANQLFLTLANSTIELATAGLTVEATKTAFKKSVVHIGGPSYFRITPIGTDLKTFFPSASNIISYEADGVGLFVGDAVQGESPNGLCVKEIKADKITYTADDASKHSVQEAITSALQQVSAISAITSAEIDALFVL